MSTMDETDDESFPCGSGYSTPPLSPTKTISTDGWLSPKTPGSPRKSRSCLVFRHFDDSADTPCLSPPESPSKPKLGSVSYRSALYAPEIFTPNSVHVSGQSEGDAITKQDPQGSNPPIVSSAHSLAHTEPWSGGVSPGFTESTGRTTASLYHTSPREQKRSHRSSSDSSATELISKHTFALASPRKKTGRLASPSSTCARLSIAEAPSKNDIRLLPLRHSSSPLRSSHRGLRNGLHSPLSKCRAETPDRFIANPRPPAVTRESFELNKPAERESMSRHGTSLSRDPFSGRLHRSRRLNDELRALRETHSTIIGRANVTRRNASISPSSNSPTSAARQVSARGVWNVGGSSAASDTVFGVSDGRGGVLGSGTNAPLFTSSFFDRADPEAELEAYERRLALALEIDQSDRVLQHSPLSEHLHSRQHGNSAPHLHHVWRDSAWTRDHIKPLLDAPQLRDDYYCTLLAYSHTANCLAVALGNVVHLWSERNGVDTPSSLNAIPSHTVTGSRHVTTLGFSSTQGGQAVLAVGRADGRIVLWSPFGGEPRFDATQPRPISSLSFRPTTVQRPSVRDKEIMVATEELLIGDEAGHIYLYSVEWPSETQSALFGWHGAMTLLARMTIHSQQICGLVWSSDGEMFASGGNDNHCFLFETRKVLRPNHGEDSTVASLHVREGERGEVVYTVTNRPGPILHLLPTAAKHKWTLNAAVKAMAFCPWHRGLLAIGGGSNDRCIYFYHTRSGTCLAIIDCAAQVTGLVWSQTRREIAATFGFAQPEHPYRIGVFAWPSCEQVAAVPWWDENRALCAVAYPGGPMDRPALGRDCGDGRTGDEEAWSRKSTGDGCIVVAASDMAIRFHEVWADRQTDARTTGVLGGGRTAGLLGGSSILEGLNGLESGEGVLR